jgi:valyl-tRNA synthetase
VTQTGRSPDEEIETRWARFWEEAGVYRYDPARRREETFVVDTPPPTVSGSLHIGHVCSYTHTDIMVRYKRMRGYNIFYPMGWDDNGLPTERRVQNVFGVRCDPSLPYDPDLRLEFGRRGDVVAVSRRNFIELCDQVVTEDERKFKDLFQRVGLSVDWRHIYATIDARSRYVSQLSFLRLLEKGEAELREAPTMWDVDFQTPVAQAEIEDREREGALYRIKFSVKDGGHFWIATTRPELLPACIAVSAHPDDERYRDLIGKTAITPLFEAPVPIIADETADPTKGTGILMVCTFGDAADVEKWRELGVPAREVIGKDGRIVSAPWGHDHWDSLDPEAALRHHDRLAGRTINQAGREVVELLATEGLIDGEPEKLRRPVKFYERGQSPLEYVVSRQWFIKIMDKKEELIGQGRKIAWHPDLMRRRYEDWVEGLNQDWNTSRQRYFGVPIPVWYRVRADGSVDYDDLILPAKDELPVDASAEAPRGYAEEQRGQPGGFVGDDAVFDTWATSSLTPLIPTGWPDDHDMFEALYPMDLRPQGQDIIRTWAFTTITRSYLEDGSIPWRHAAISGMVLDPERKKMSKSKGNVVLPTDVLDQWGSDAVRYWASSARLGVDPAADPKVMKEGRRLVTKIRNAARLIQGYEGESGECTHPLDRALIARLRALIEQATERWENWDHAGALAATETWFWSDLCDNYLELSKARAYAQDPSALATLRIALGAVLRMFAPYVPYITEEIWNAGRRQPESIHVTSWPAPDDLPATEDDGSFDAAVEILTQARRAKSEAKVSVRFPIERLQVRGSERQIAVLEPVMADVDSTLNVAQHDFVFDDGADGLVALVALGQREPAAPSNA